MRPREEPPEGVKAAAIRFAKACERDGDPDACELSAYKGQPTVIDLRRDGESRMWMFRDGCWHDYEEVGNG